MRDIDTARRRARGKDVPKSERSVLPPWALKLTKLFLSAVSKVLWRTQYLGLEHLPSGGGFVIAANHQTYLDPFWLGIPVKSSLRFLAWDQLFNWPIVGRLIAMLGAWPLQLEKGDPTAIKRALHWLRGGGAVVIFPEGGRSRADGAMGKFKKGAVRIALEASVPILPATIRGGNRVWPKGYRFPRFRRVQIIFHPPINVRHLGEEDTRACASRETERLQEIIATPL